MRFINWLRRNGIAWLTGRRGPFSSIQGCRLDTGACLFPEAEINTVSGSPDHILIGRNSHIRGRLLTYGHGGRISIGEWCYVGVRTEIWSMESVSIGNRVLIAHDVNIHDGTAHSMDHVERHEHFRHIIEKGHPRMASQLPGVQSAPVKIEDDVWISFGVTILRGVTIGRRSVIAAGSIVAQDVPPDSVYRCIVTPVITPIDESKEPTLQFNHRKPNQ